MLVSCPDYFSGGSEKCGLETRLGVCEPLMPDVMASKAQSQLCELSGSTFGFNTQEFSMVGGYTENLEKPLNCQNWRVGACLGMGACSGQYGNILHTGNWQK